MNEIELLLHSPATLALLVANIALSFAAFQNQRLMDRLMYDVGRIRRHGEWYRWFTSAFIHNGPLHLGINMLGLYSLGPAFESGLGTGAFLGLYFGSLLGSSAWEWMEHFRDSNHRSVGASGALAGLASAFAIFAPLSQFLFLFVFPMPAFVFAICFIAVSAWASAGGARDGLGHSAHLGGALAGIAIVCIFWPSAPQAMIEEIMTSIRDL